MAISKAWVAQHYAAVKSADPLALVTLGQNSWRSTRFYRPMTSTLLVMANIATFTPSIPIRLPPLTDTVQSRRSRSIVSTAVSSPTTAVRRPCCGPKAAPPSTVTDPAQLLAFAAIYPLIAASDAIDMFNWYAYDGNAWGQLGDRGAGFNATATAHREAIKWVTGATWTAPIARVPGPNQIRNPATSGGSAGNWPTNWGSFNPDSAKGINVQVVGVGTESGTPYLDVRIYGTAAATATGYVQINFDTSVGIPCVPGPNSGPRQPICRCPVPRVEACSRRPSATRISVLPAPITALAIAPRFLFSLGRVSVINIRSRSQQSTPARATVQPYVRATVRRWFDCRLYCPRLRTSMRYRLGLYGRVHQVGRLSGNGAVGRQWRSDHLHDPSWIRLPPRLQGKSSRR